MKIESRKNSHIVAAKKVWQDKKYRDQSGLVWIEGIHLVQEALTSNCKFHSLFVSASKTPQSEIEDLYSRLEDASIENYLISDDVESFLFETQTPQGIGALIYRPNLASKVDGSILVLDGIQDPGNVGTLIRSAEAAGIGTIYTLSGTADIWSGKVIRASMGSVFRVPIRTNINVDDLIQLKSANYLLVGTGGEAAVNYKELKIQSPIALVLGSEGKGIREEVQQQLDSSVMIPMRQPVESLNVAIAGSILMFSFLEKID